MPSSTVAARSKKTYLAKPLTAEVARSIGIEEYYAPCRRAFKSILTTLDREVGKPLMKTVPATQKEVCSPACSAAHSLD